jgi:uncharacterized protein Yka (UPF0111/DUF47 family)
VFDDLQKMAGGIATLASKMLDLVRALPGASDEGVRSKLDDIRRVEEEVDAEFDVAATRIMDLEIFPVNTDYLLTIARELDRMSDLIERTSILLEWRRKLMDEESELLASASTQVVQLTENISSALASLGVDDGQVMRICGVIVQREEALDQIRDHYYMISSKSGYPIEKRLWLTEVLGNLDVVGDAARDLTITFRVVSKKLETHRRLDVKKGTMG